MMHHFHRERGKGRKRKILFALEEFPLKLPLQNPPSDLVQPDLDLPE